MSHLLQLLSTRHEVDRGIFLFIEGTTSCGYGNKDRGQSFVFMAVHFAKSQVFLCTPGAPFNFWLEESEFFLLQQESILLQRLWKHLPRVFGMTYIFHNLPGVEEGSNELPTQEIMVDMSWPCGIT